MRHSVYRLFWSWNYEKEEKWINEMSAKGMHLVGLNFCKYIFQDGARGEYTYRIELLNQYPSHPESISYIRFLEETGVEHIASYMRWVYLRKKASEGSFDLYSDYKSRIGHLKRIITLILCLYPLELSVWISNLNLALKGSTIRIVICALLTAIVFLSFFGLIKLTINMRKLKRESKLYE